MKAVEGLHATENRKQKKTKKTAETQLTRMEKLIGRI